MSNDSNKLNLEYPTNLLLTNFAMNNQQPISKMKGQNMNEALVDISTIINFITTDIKGYYDKEHECSFLNNRIYCSQDSLNSTRTN